MNTITKYATAGAPKAVAPRTYRFIASTGELDRDNDVIEPSAWKLDSYLKNPVVLMGHDSGAAPVARASRVSVEGGRLIVDVQFPSEGASEASDEAYALVSEGFMRAVSVGFRPLEREPLPDGRGYRYRAVELLEVSLVSVPANPSAVLAARAGGKSGSQSFVLVDERGVPMSRAAVAEAVAGSVERHVARALAGEHYIVTPENVAASVRRAVGAAVQREIRKHTGRLD